MENDGDSTQRREGVKRRKVGLLLGRIHLLHIAAEYFFRAICGADKVFLPSTRRPGGGHSIPYKLMWWHPAIWVAWSRIVIFRDEYGSAYFIPSRRN